MKLVSSLQTLGRALMLPIAVLPVAGILLRLGQDDIAGPIQSVLPFLHLSFLAAAGGAVFDNLGLLFAIGAAVGFARDNHGAAGLAGVVSFLVATSGAKAMLQPPPALIASATPDVAALLIDSFKERSVHDLSVPIGIVSGVLAGLCYNRYSTIRLPEYLAFFGGRRFVPIAMGLVGAVMALIVGLGYDGLHGALIAASHAVLGAGAAGLFLYGALNRLLIVTGLHHILNNIAWFIVGDYHGATGDLKRFFAGDPTAGGFMAGFFPVMMFGLPAACLAMYHAAPKHRRSEIGGMLVSMALTSFLTGVTEPIEFTFMFLAPALYAAHMVLTGLAFVVTNGLGVKLGFSFSAGLFDYLINFKLATRPLLLLPIGAVYFGVYYGVFLSFNRALDLKTPGRDAPDATPEKDAPVMAGGQALALLQAWGGAQNLTGLDACTTRLRVTVKDQALVQEAALRRLGARGVVRPSATAVQVILGPTAELVMAQMRALAGAFEAPPPIAALGEPLSHDGPVDAAALIARLGGAESIVSVSAASTRLLVGLRNAAFITPDQFADLGVKAAVFANSDQLHLIIGPQAQALATKMQAELRR